MYTKTLPDCSSDGGGSSVPAKTRSTYSPCERPAKAAAFCNCRIVLGDNEIPNVRRRDSSGIDGRPGPFRSSSVVFIKLKRPPVASALESILGSLRWTKYTTPERRCHLALTRVEMTDAAPAWVASQATQATEPIPMLLLYST